MICSKFLSKNFVKFAKIKNLFKFIFFLNVAVLFYFIILYNNLNIITKSDNKVSKLIVNNLLIKTNQFSITNTTRESEKILLVTNSRNSSITNELIALFESFRFNYKILYDKTLLKSPRLIGLKRNIFSLIIIDSIDVVLNDKYLEVKHYIFDASSYFNVGIIIFLKNNQKSETLEGNSNYLTLNLSQNLIEIKFKPIDQVLKCNLNKFTNVKNFYRTTKFNDNENILNKIESEQEIASFIKYDSKVYESILNCQDNNGITILKTKTDSSKTQRMLLIGIDLNNLLIASSLLLDFISFASNGIFKTEDKRFMQIDIDDIFVGAKNTRMVPDDVRSLIKFQENFLNKNVFNSSVEKFKFNLGFSGYYYQSGNEKENKGDELLISKFKYLYSIEDSVNLKSYYSFREKFNS